MAVSDITTYNLLNRWATLMGVNPFHFNQVSGAGAPLHDNSVWIQYERDVVADALYQAVAEIATWIGYWPRPVWLSEDIQFGNGWPYQLQTLRTTHGRGKVQAFGQRGSTLISAGVLVTYSDTTGDTIDDTATITVVTTVTDPTEIQAFFQVADGAAGAGDERWQIEPLTVTISAGVATITGHRALFAHPARLWAVPYAPTDPNFLTKHNGQTTDPNDFVTHVDIYRVYNDTTTPGQLLSDPFYSECCLTLGTTLTDAASIRLVDGEIGSFQVRAQDCTGCHIFNRVRVYYKAGLPLVNGMMDRRLEIAVVRYANTIMSETLKTVTDLPSQPTRSRWADDREKMPRDELQPGDLKNPFGLLRGQVEAWRRLKYLIEPSGGRI